MKTLKERLSDWHDVDDAACELAVVMGIITDHEAYRKHKKAFLTNNPTSEFLFMAVDQMIDAGILEMDDEKDRLRWSPNYQMKVSWE